MTQTSSADLIASCVLALEMKQKQKQQSFSTGSRDVDACMNGGGANTAQRWMNRACWMGFINTTDHSTPESPSSLSWGDINQWWRWVIIYVWLPPHQLQRTVGFQECLPIALHCQELGHTETAVDSFSTLLLFLPEEQIYLFEMLWLILCTLFLYWV